MMTSNGEGRSGYAKYFRGEIHTLTEEATNEDVIRVYNDWADKYDKDLFSVGCVKHKPMVEVFEAVVREAMPNKPKSEIRIMDLGAGTGLLGVELNKVGYTNVDALDVSQGMLDEAKKKKVYTKFICAPLNEQRTPGIETGEYNAIISSGVVSAAYGHVRPAALLEMIRVVSEGGVIYFNVRTAEISHFRDSMVQLEKQGLWTLIREEKVPHYNSEDSALPKKTSVFAFKVNYKN